MVECMLNLVSKSDANLSDFNIGPCISPYKELIAYEYLWSKPNSSLKNIAGLFVGRGEGVFPSTIVTEEENSLVTDDIDIRKKEIKDFIDQKLKNNPHFSILT
jgi:hypothetical protein